MIGSNGARMLADRRCRTSTAWNTWYTRYGNTAEGFAELNARDHERGRARPAATRPRSSAAPACSSSSRRTRSSGRTRTRRQSSPVTPDGLPAHLAARSSEAGADEAILDPPPDHRGVDPGARRVLSFLAAEQLVVGHVADPLRRVADDDRARRARPSSRPRRRRRTPPRRSRSPGQRIAPPPIRAPRRIVGPLISSCRRSVRPMKLSFVVTTHGAMKTSSSSVEYAVM